MLPLIGLVPLLAASVRAQVTATGTQGPTNPPQATMGTPVNQTSMSRLASVNSVDDWCLFAPPEPGVDIGSAEAFVVAWCTQPRNNARVIPDGTLTGVHFVKTDAYVQVMALGDFTKVNVMDGDFGGELDPHGPTGEGNPVGGNVTTDVSGSDVAYQEWMSFISYEMFCIRVCTSENSTYPAAEMCEHKLDVMGCRFVMPGDYTDGVFDSCDGDVAYPPGWYPVEAGGSTSYSVFEQYYTGQYTQDGSLVGYTVGTTVTPSSVYSTPATSQCTTTSSIANGLQLNAEGSVTGSNTNSGSSPTGSNDAEGDSSNNNDNNDNTDNGARSVVATTPVAALCATGFVAIISAIAILA